MASVDDLITENIDVWTSAIRRKSSAGRGGGKKIELYGVKKLRELILDLAVRGLLVPQDSGDEPASVLLEEITRKKLELFEQGAIKKQRSLPKNSKSDVPLTLPLNWILVKLVDIALVDMGNSPPGNTYNDTGDGVPLINGPVEFSAGPFGNTIRSKFTTAPNVTCDKGDILVCVRGATTGRTNIADFSACIGRGVARVQSLSYQPFVNLLMWENQHKLLAKGTGTTFPSISYVDLAGHTVYLPPLLEQHRIVAKVDELMALCDRLEQQTESSITAHQTLVQTLLGVLTQAATQPDALRSDTPTPFTQAWNRLAEHFDTVFTTEDSIEQLKQTILQLAVMGKLVPQDPNDEPASELLKRIVVEKAELIKAKKIKKQKALPEIGEEEKPYGLPDGWEWKYLADMFALVTDGDHQAPPKSESGVPFLVIGNLNTGLVDLSNCRYVPQEYYENLDWGRKPKSVDLLYTVTGSYGIPIEVKITEKFCVQRHVAILKAVDSTPVAYIALLMRSQYAFNYATTIATGIAQKTVPLTGLRLMPVSLPPEEEQHRIVAKVTELMMMCNQLHKKITDFQKTQALMADVAGNQTIRQYL